MPPGYTYPEVIVPDVTTGHCEDSAAIGTWFNDYTTIIIGPDGTEADIADALADQHAAGGGTVVTMGLEYDVEGLSDPAFEITLPTVSLKSASRTTFNFTGTGVCIAVRMAAPNADQAGCIQGIQVIGNSGVDAVGIHMGDVVGFTLRDVIVYGFNGTNGVGLWLDNQAYWTEQCTFDEVWLGDNKTALLFSINGGNPSFGYNRFNLRMNINAGQTGFKSEDGAFVYSGDFKLKTNVTSTGRVGAVGGTSLWLHESVDIKGEWMGGGGVGAGIEVDSGAAFRVYGVVHLPSLPCANANAPSISPTYSVRGGNEGTVDGNPLDLSSGTIADIFGSGTTVRVSQVTVGDSDNPYSANGFLQGAGIACPYVCMFDAPNNAFVVYALGFGAAPNTMREVLRIDAYNNVLLQECVTPPSTPAAGVYLFVQGGALKAKDDTGAVTVLT